MGSKRWNREASELLQEPVLGSAYVGPRGTAGGALVSLIGWIPVVGDQIQRYVEIAKRSLEEREGERHLSIGSYQRMYVVIGPTTLGVFHLKGVFRKSVGKKLLLVPRQQVTGGEARMGLLVRKVTIRLADGAVLEVEAGRLQVAGEVSLELEAGFGYRRRAKKIAATLQQPPSETSRPHDLSARTPADTVPAGKV